MSNPVEQKKVQLKGGAITFVKAGKGSPILFLHGLGGGAMSWEEQLRSLSNDYGIIAWNTPGYGGSDNRPPDVDAYADAAAHLIEALEIAPLPVVGHSMGGVIGTRLAARYPELVAMIILSSTFPGNGEPPDAPLSEGYRNRIHELQTLDPHEFGMARALSMVAKGTAPETVSKVARVAATVNERGFVNACTMLDRADNRASLRAIKVPVLILEGGKDPIIPREMGDELELHIPHADRKALPEVGHASYMESPEEFNRTLVSFIRQHGWS